MDLGKNMKLELDKQFSNELGKVLNTGSENVSDFLTTSQTIRNAVTSEDIEEDMIVRNKFKKGDFMKNLSKGETMDKPIGKLFSMGKSENKEAATAGSAGGFEAPLFGKGEMKEKWSQKYKDSIDCDNPKGFSQKAHCNGKKKKGEFKEATSSASSGSYETPAAWAKSTNKKDWRGKSKTLFPGGKFVTVKKKCKKFPYCNQGDINALKLTNEDILQKTISDLSKKYNISEQMIKKMMLKDYHNLK